eukprot:GHVP01047535.1.p1 GENE.GHVP01047535.1~~GHVP01047535.1.p1  ORF type:complete len:414 (+),score=76.09 GHVP01047535.1:368-1609(+)
MSKDNEKYVDLSKIEYSENIYGTSCKKEEFKKFNENFLTAKMNFAVLSENFMEKFKGEMFKKFKEDITKVKESLCTGAKWFDLKINKSLKPETMDFTTLPIMPGGKHDFEKDVAKLKINDDLAKKIDKQLPFYPTILSSNRFTTGNKLRKSLIGYSGPDTEEEIDPLTAVYCMHKEIPDCAIHLDFFLGRVSFILRDDNPQLLEMLEKGVDKNNVQSSPLNEEVKKFCEAYTNLAKKTEYFWDACNKWEEKVFEHWDDTKCQKILSLFDLPMSFNFTFKPPVMVEYYQKPTINMGWATPFILNPKDPIGNFPWKTYDTKSGAVLPTSIKRLRIFDPSDKQIIPLPKERVAAAKDVCLAKDLQPNQFYLPVITDERRAILMVELTGGQVVCFRLKRNQNQNGKTEPFQIEFHIF